MSLILGIVAAFACFTRIPMPTLAWDRKTTRLMLAGLPVVGLTIALLVWLTDTCLRAWGTGETLRGCVLALVPVAVSGGIHLDGFADVVDALSSHAEPEKRRAILKDPHVGAFAVIGICSILILSCALASELDAAHVGPWCATYVVSRGLCAVAALTFRPRPESGMLSSLRKGTDRKASLALLAAELACVWGWVLASDVRLGLAAALAGLICYGLVWRVSERAFDGMSGDIAGYLVCVSELAMQAAIIVAGRVW